MSNYFRIKSGLLLDSAGGSNTVQLKSASSIGSSYALTLPSTLPASGHKGVFEVDNTGAAALTASPRLESPEIHTSMLLYDPAGSNKITMQSAAMTGDYAITWPDALPGSGTAMLVTDNTGALSWTPPVTDHTALTNLTGGTYTDGGHTNLVQYKGETRDPIATDDTAAYKLGAMWLNTTTKKTFVNVANTSSAAVWGSVSFANAATNNSKTYSHTFTLAANTVGPVIPSFSIDFTSSVFYARVKVVAIDPTNQDRVSTLVFDATGGRLDAGTPQSIAIGSISQVSTDATVDFSNDITTTATTIVLAKTANLVTGNYTLIVHVEVLNGTVSQLYDVTGAAAITTFAY